MRFTISLRIACPLTALCMLIACFPLDASNANKCRLDDDCLDGKFCCDSKCVDAVAGQSPCSGDPINAYGIPIGRWHELTTPGPSARAYPYCATDGANTLFVFGGVMTQNTTRLQDVWALDVETGAWEQLWSPAGQQVDPAFTPRYAGAAVWHQGEIFVAGGIYAASGVIDFQVWAFDTGARSWRQISNLLASGDMPPSAWLGAALDENSQRLWLYGGDATTHSVTDEPFFFGFSLIDEHAHWQSVVDTSDHHFVVDGHAMVWFPHATEPRLIVYGGIEGKRYMDAYDARDETWEYSFVTHHWNLLSLSELELPPDRAEHSLTRIDRTRALMFGGLAASVYGDPLNDLWLFDNAATAWRPIDPSDAVRPPARSGHCAVDVFDGTGIVVFGGESRVQSLGDSWVFVVP